jgi:hypothetical protein
MIEIKQHPADSVLSVELAKISTCGIPFLNVKIRARHNRSKEQLTGPGIYGLFYEGRLIYTGKYLGMRSAPFSGDVANQRWWAHIGTITMRGHRVSIRNATARQIASLKNLKAPLRALESPPDRFFIDRGCVSTPNRIAFANLNWDYLGVVDANKLLDKFVFLYARFTKNPFVDTQLLLSHLGCVERGLISRYKPCCNREIPAGTSGPGLRLEEAPAPLLESLQVRRFAGSSSLLAGS